jgi:hypothetical protein
MESPKTSKYDIHSLSPRRGPSEDEIRLKRELKEHFESMIQDECKYYAKKYIKKLKDVKDKGIGQSRFEQHSEGPTARDSLKEESVSSFPAGPEYFVQDHTEIYSGNTSQDHFHKPDRSRFYLPHHEETARRNFRMFQNKRSQ